MTAYYINTSVKPDNNINNIPVISLDITISPMDACTYSTLSIVHANLMLPMKSPEYQYE